MKDDIPTTEVDIAAAMLSHLTRRVSDNGEPFVPPPYSDAPRWVRRLWDAMTDDHDGGYRAASEDAWHVLATASAEDDPTAEELADDPGEYVEGMYWGAGDLLTWYMNGGLSDVDNLIAEVWEDGIRYRADDIDGDPIPTILESARTMAAERNIRRAARALAEFVEEVADDMEGE